MQKISNKKFFEYKKLYKPVDFTEKEINFFKKRGFVPLNNSMDISNVSSCIYYEKKYEVKGKIPVTTPKILLYKIEDEWFLAYIEYKEFYYNKFLSRFSPDIYQKGYGEWQGNYLSIYILDGTDDVNSLLEKFIWGYEK